MYDPDFGKLSPTRHNGAVVQPPEGRVGSLKQPLVRRAPTRPGKRAGLQAQAQLRPCQGHSEAVEHFPKSSNAGFITSVTRLGDGEPDFWVQ
jgi:hypothetical protein